MTKISPNQFIKKYSGYIGPRIALDEAKIVSISDIGEGKVKLKGQLGEVTVKTSNKKPYLQIYEAEVSDATGSVRAVWFNTRSLQYIRRSKDFIFLGKVVSDYGGKSLMSPIFTTTAEVEKWAALYKKLNS